MEYANIERAKQKDSVLIVYFRPTRPFDLVSMAGCIARGTEDTCDSSISWFANKDLYIQTYDIRISKHGDEQIKIITLEGSFSLQPAVPRAALVAD